MRILFIGDISGRPGRKAVSECLPEIVRDMKIDFVVANGENAAGGSGITKDKAQELFGLGINVLTMGNHVWDKKEVFEFIGKEPRMIRPANYPHGTPGLGGAVFTSPRGHKVAVINASGRVFMPPLDCPFRAVETLAAQFSQETPVILVDFHAEATSEKMALGWFLDGRVTAVLGTHTHVQTADERILPGGTAYISDVGMCGPKDSVLGVKKEIVVEKFISQLPARFEIAGGPYQFNAVVVEVDTETGNAVDIFRIQNFEF